METGRFFYSTHWFRTLAHRCFNSRYNSTGGSINSTGVIAVEGFGEVEKPGENLFLYENEPIKMGEYTLTYVGDSVKGVDVYYKVNYVKKDEKGKVVERFQLTPRAQQNPK